MSDDFKRAQMKHTSPGCGIKCPYCCGSKTWSTKQARAVLKAADRDLAERALLNHFRDKDQCGMCGELESTSCAHDC